MWIDWVLSNTGSTVIQCHHVLFKKLKVREREKSLPSIRSQHQQENRPQNGTHLHHKHPTVRFHYTEIKQLSLLRCNFHSCLHPRIQTENLMYHLLRNKEKQLEIIHDNFTAN